MILRGASCSMLLASSAVRELLVAVQQYDTAQFATTDIPSETPTADASAAAAAVDPLEAMTDIVSTGSARVGTWITTPSFELESASLHAPTTVIFAWDGGVIHPALAHCFQAVRMCQ